MPGNHLPRMEKRAGSMFDNKGSPMRCSPVLNPHISLPSAPTHRYPGVFQSLCCRDALGWVYGQHLVDEIFRFRSDRVPFRGGELPKQRGKGERWQRAPLLLGCFSCNLGQVGEMVATGKSCQIRNQRAGVKARYESWDKACLSHKVALKYAKVCAWAWQRGQHSATSAEESTCSYLF